MDGQNVWCANLKSKTIRLNKFPHVEKGAINMYVELFLFWKTRFSGYKGMVKESEGRMKEVSENDFP